MQNTVLNDLNNRQLGRFSYDTNDKRFSEALRLTDALIDTFISEVLQDGATPIVVILPFRNQYFDTKAYGHPLYLDVLKICKSRDISCVDGLKLLNGHKQLWSGEYHLSKKSSEIIAQEISRIIK